MYKLKHKFNDFVVRISEKESFLVINLSMVTHESSIDPDFMKHKIHLIHLFIFQILLSMPLAEAAAYIIV